jgi:hypothetical protein
MDDSEPLAQLKATGVYRVMSCHHSQPGERWHCIGWIHNQITIGNNLPMRMRMLFCENRDDLEIDGEQVDTFEETLT